MTGTADSIVTDDLGPFELLLLSFPRNAFTGEITPALSELLDSGQIRIVDLAIVSRDTDGTATILEYQELSTEVAAALVRLQGSVSGLLSEGDLKELADDMEPGSTAAVLLVEHVWATRLAKAVRAAQGSLVLAERIPHAVIAEARESLLAAAAEAAAEA